jgi:gluconate 2-dehydrogenase subunit 3-like protein
MTRRDANWLILQAAASSGAATFLTPWLRANQPHVHPSAPPDPHDWSSYHPKFFSAEEFQWLDSYSAILIPSDETPGAREAHVAAFIDFVVNAAAQFAPEVQDHWRLAMRWLRTNNFGNLSLQDQLALVTAAAGPESDRSLTHPGFSTYQLIKQMTVHAFYTSRVGLIDVLEYQGIAYLTEFPACTHPEHHSV